MKLTFLGTRGFIDPSTRRHRHHTSLLVEYRGRAVRIDAGETWLGKLDGKAGALVLTHAHPDHAGGLKEGSPVPVHAPKRTWDSFPDFPIGDRHTLPPRRWTDIEGIQFKPFPVEHSLKAPAVGYRIRAGRLGVFYCPDVVYIEDRAEAMGGADLYIGDGATLTGDNFIRKRGDRLIGHTPFRTQLTWCAKEGVPRAVVTHCGSQIVEGDERGLNATLRELADERGVRAEIAHDGMELVLR